MSDDDQESPIPVIDFAEGKAKAEAKRQVKIERCLHCDKSKAAKVIRFLFDIGVSAAVAYKFNRKSIHAYVDNACDIIDRVHDAFASVGIHFQ